MKKILILALALVMAFSMTTAVSAADGEPLVGQDSLPQTSGTPVEIKITVNGSVVNQYAFDIEYGSMSFTYGSPMEWNPDTYEYEPSGTAGVWTAANNGDQIMVVNHSNAPIYCAAKVQSDNNSYGAFTLKVTDGAQIPGCDVGTTKGSVFHVMKVSIEGSPIVSTATEQKIGSVVVTVSQNPIVETTGN